MPAGPCNVASSASGIGSKGRKRIGAGCHGSLAGGNILLGNDHDDTPGRLGAFDVNAYLEPG